MSHTILLVDADDTTTTFLADQLSADDYRPVAAHTPATVYESAESLAPDLVILGDLAERHTALGLLDDIRSGARPFDPDLAVLVLSEHHTELDVLRAFDHGADDVVAKSTAYPELRARIAALLRRRRHRGSGEVIRVRDLEIDKRTRAVVLAGEPVGLTQREFALLCHLATEPERVFTKRELIQELWGYPPECKTRTLDSHALRLRQKLGAHGDRSWVLSLWGVGYALTAPRDRARDRAAA